MRKQHHLISLITILAFALVVIPVLSISATPVFAQSDEALRIGVIPALTTGQTRVGINKLGEHLSNELERPVRVQVLSDYAAVVEGLGFGHVDMAYLGPRTFVIANHQY